MNTWEISRFGKVLQGEMETCQQIAQQTGILVDPVYTLAAWEMAMLLCKEEAKGGSEVVMLHTGGSLGMFGLAQRYKNYFGALKKGLSHMNRGTIFKSMMFSPHVSFCF